MAKRLTQASKSEVESIAMSVPGVAFAEMTSIPGQRPVLRVVCWQNVSPEETAGKVESTLLESLDVIVEGGDVVLAGVAHEQSGAVRVIDLGGDTWVTEPIRHDPIVSLGSIRPQLLSLSISRSKTGVIVRVEVEHASSVHSSEQQGPATDRRIRRLVCDATANATAAAMGLGSVDIAATTLVSGEPSFAIVVADAPMLEARAGVAEIGADPLHSFAIATMQAVAALHAR